MWLWESELRQLGFRRKSERYWQCERRFGLPPHGHLSVFSWGEQTIPGDRRAAPRFVVELTEFHVTLHLGLDHLHFYYHELTPNDWSPGGHTSGRAVRRLGYDPRELRAAADVVAVEVVAALGGVLRPRRRRARRG